MTACFFIVLETGFQYDKDAPRRSHCGGMEEGRVRDPPQAENVPRHILNHIFFINGGRGWKNTEASFWLLPELWTA